MRIGGWDFAPRAVPTLAAIAFVALTLSLGRWQDRRAGEKLERQALLEARAAAAALDLTPGAGPAADLVYRRVRATGSFVAERQLFVDNRQHGGRAGFHVVTPLRLAGSDALVLVLRGWTPRTAAYPAAPAVAVPEGERTVEGLATLPPARVLELGSGETVAGNVWQNLSIERFAAKAGVPVLPVVLLASPPAPGLAAVEDKPDAGVDKHREYSLTWFSLAATCVALWIGLNLKRAPRG